MTEKMKFSDREENFWISMYVESLSKGSDTENAKRLADQGLVDFRAAFPLRFLKIKDCEEQSNQAVKGDS